MTMFICAVFKLMLMFQTFFPPVTGLLLSVSRRAVVSKGSYSAFRCYSIVKDKSDSDVYIAQIKDVDHVFRSLYYLDTNPSNSKDIPILLLGGTAQVIDSYVQHIKYISKERRLILPELRGQGKRTDLLSSAATMSQYIQDISDLLDKLDIDCVDCAGFSFGGRVSLGLAAYLPRKIRRLSVTGVPLHRSSLGRLILSSWVEGLKNQRLQEVAWSFVLNGYSESFLEKHHRKVPYLVNNVVNNNNLSKLLDLMQYSHIQNDDDEYSIPSCSRMVSCPTQVIGSTEDRIAGYRNIMELSYNIKGSFETIDGAGHMCPFEEPQIWRKLIQGFFSA